MSNAHGFSSVHPNAIIYLMSSPRIALYGGAFDPPHLGHVLAITHVLNSGLADEVWLVPVGDDRGDKEPPQVNALYRKKMSELLIKSYFSGKPVKLCSLQLDGKLPGSVTIDLLEHLEEIYPKHSFLFVIGADNIAKLQSWTDSERLLKKVEFLVVARPGEDHITPRQGKFTLLKDSQKIEATISSSLARALVREGKCMSGIIPEEIAQFIKANKLYS